VPHSEKVMKTYTLGDGIRATASDHTRHYFGGYYHVRIQVSADVPVSAGAFAEESEQLDALRRLGPFVSFSRTLERMAVPDSEIDAVRQHLLASFDTNELPYLVRAGFADSFIQSEYRKALKSRASVPRNQT